MYLPGALRCNTRCNGMRMRSYLSRIDVDRIKVERILSSLLSLSLLFFVCFITAWLILLLLALVVLFHPLVMVGMIFSYTHHSIPHKRLHPLLYYYFDWMCVLTYDPIGAYWLNGGYQAMIRLDCIFLFRHSWSICHFNFWIDYKSMRCTNLRWLVDFWIKHKL